MQGAWIASLLSFGIIAGYLLNPVLIDSLGPKRTLLLLAAPQISSCLLVYFGRSWIVLCCARIIGGIGYGGGLCSTAVYVSQIGDENNRGFFLTFVKMFFNIGVFVTMIFGAFMSYNTMNLAILGIPVLFVVLFIFMPDTDQFCEKGEYVQEKLTNNENECEEGGLGSGNNIVGGLGGGDGNCEVGRGVEGANNLDVVKNSDGTQNFGVVRNSVGVVADGVAKHLDGVAKYPDGAAKNADSTIVIADGVVKNAGSAKNPYAVLKISDGIAENPYDIIKNSDRTSQNSGGSA